MTVDLPSEESPEDWKATRELRILRRFVWISDERGRNEDRLQELYRNGDGDEKWVDVPVVVEA